MIDRAQVSNTSGVPEVSFANVSCPKIPLIEMRGFLEPLGQCPEDKHGSKLCGQYSRPVKKYKKDDSGETRRADNDNLLKAIRAE